MFHIIDTTMESDNEIDWADCTGSGWMQQESSGWMDIDLLIERGSEREPKRMEEKVEMQVLDNMI